MKRYQKQFYESRREQVAPKLDEFSVLNIYLPEPSEHWKEAFDITKGIILKFRNSVEEHGSRFVLVSLSNAAQVYPETQQGIEQYHMGFRLISENRTGLSRNSRVKTEFLI